MIFVFFREKAIIPRKVSIQKVSLFKQARAPKGIPPTQKTILRNSHFWSRLANHDDIKCGHARRGRGKGSD